LSLIHDLKFDSNAFFDKKLEIIFDKKLQNAKYDLWMINLSYNNILFQISRIMMVYIDSNKNKLYKYDKY